MSNVLPANFAQAPLSLSTSEMDEVCREMGLMDIPKGGIEKLRRLGIGFEEAGISRLANGYSLLSMEAIRQAVVKLQQKIALCDDDEKMKNLVYALGYIAHKGSQISETAVNTEETARAGQEELDKRKRRSFLPGQQVVIPVQVNIQNKS